MLIFFKPGWVNPLIVVYATKAKISAETRIQAIRSNFISMDRLEKLKSFLQENPRDNFIRHAMALEYIKAGDDTQARTLFENILQEDPAYTGSYYHLAKLLERNNDPDAAVKVYEKGMEMARQAGDDLSYRELKAAWEELTF